MGSRWLVLLSTAVLNYSHHRCYCEYTNCGRELAMVSEKSCTLQWAPHTPLAAWPPPSSAKADILQLTTSGWLAAPVLQLHEDRTEKLQQAYSCLLTTATLALPQRPCAAVTGRVLV